jgi:hypothetical protein
MRDHVENEVFMKRSGSGSEIEWKFLQNIKQFLSKMKAQMENYIHFEVKNIKN